MHLLGTWLVVPESRATNSTLHTFVVIIVDHNLLIPTVSCEGRRGRVSPSAPPHDYRLYRHHERMATALASG